MVELNRWTKGVIRLYRALIGTIASYADAVLSPRISPPIRYDSDQAYRLRPQILVTGLTERQDGL